MEERREFQRWRCLIPCIGSGQGVLLTGKIVDLSFGGACIAIPTEMPTLNAELDVTVDGTYTVKGRVVYLKREQDNWKYHDHFGLEFTASWIEKLEKLKPLFQRYVDSRT